MRAVFSFFTLEKLKKNLFVIHSKPFLYLPVINDLFQGKIITVAN
jgi:hypothetical protein